MEPKVSRDTRLLLTIILISLSMLWVLARIRFPDRPATPNPVPPVLAQLSPPSAFDDIAAAVAQVSPRLQTAIVPLQFQPGSGAALARGDVLTASAFRFRDDLALALIGSGGDGSGRLIAGGTEVARDPASRLIVVRAPGQAVAPAAVWVPRRTQAPRFLIAASAWRGGAALRPVFVDSLAASTSPLWPGPIWALPPATDLAAGTFVFSADGALVGLVIGREGQRAIVPAETLLTAADRLVDAGPRRPARLGIQVQALTPELGAAIGAERGVVVAWVDPDGPAADQLAVADVIQDAGDAAIASVEEWRARAGRMNAGDAIVLKVRRGGEVREVRLTAAAAVRPVPATRPLGLTLRTIRGTGVEVLRIAPDSSAARAGLEAGDIVTVAGSVQAPTAAQLTRLFAAAGGKPLIAGVTRGNRHFVVVLDSAW